MLTETGIQEPSKVVNMMEIKINFMIQALIRHISKQIMYQEL